MDIVESFNNWASSIEKVRSSDSYCKNRLKKAKKIAFTVEFTVEAKKFFYPTKELNKKGEPKKAKSELIRFTAENGFTCCAVKRSDPATLLRHAANIRRISGEKAAKQFLAMAEELPGRADYLENGPAKKPLGECPPEFITTYGVIEAGVSLEKLMPDFQKNVEQAIKMASHRKDTASVK
jgi:hypothetical protein